MTTAETRGLLESFAIGQHVQWVEADEDHNSASILTGYVHAVFSEGDAEIPGTDISMPASAEEPIALLEQDSPHITYLLRPVSALAIAPVEEEPAPSPVDTQVRDSDNLSMVTDSVPMRDLKSAQAELNKREGK